MPPLRLVGEVCDLGERLKFGILCDERLDVAEIESEVSLEEIFDGI
jgi:hypothetical protein